MPKRIEKLRIEAFRGATTPLELDFDKSKPMAMIFGENGTGKSTIVDAIDFICNQKYGSIEDRSSVKKKNHLPAIGKTKSHIEVTLYFDGNYYTANHRRSTPETTPPGFPSAKILRRSKILALIDAPPNKRFEALEQFLTVPNIEKCENTLRNAVKNKQKEYEESTRALTQVKEQLEDLKSKHTTDEKPAEEWAKEITEIDKSKLQQVIANAEEIEKHQENLNAARTSLATAKSTLDDKIENEKTVEKELKTFQEKQAVGNDDLHKLLDNAKAFLAKHPETVTCPVCEQKISPNDVIVRLKQRLDGMAELGRLLSSLKRAKKEKESAESVFKTRENDYNACAKALVKKIRSQSQESTEHEEVSFDYDKLISEITATDDNQEVQKAKEELEKYNRYKAALEAEKQRAKEKQKSITAIQTTTDSIKTKEEKAHKDEKILNRLKRYEEIVHSERKQYIDNILLTVSSEVERLYQIIHPDEGLGGFRLYLKEKVKGSLEYDGNFQDSQNIPPQAYYSESHLDTLGICMFLALAKHFNDDNTIVILDDVITSIDEAHRERFLQMLHDEADSFCHMVVTTHYRPWRDIYRIGGGPANKVQFFDLQLWTKEAGVRHSKSRIVIDELKNLKDNITVENRQNIASKSGILLEGILDHLALKYSLKVPRQPLQKYELRILFDSLSKYKKHIKIIHADDEGKKSETEIKPLIEALENMQWIRNQIGCHWNLDGSLLSDTKVKEFAEATIALCEALTCKQCGNIPNRDKTGSFWQCQCGKKHMYPLQMP